MLKKSKVSGQFFGAASKILAWSSAQLKEEVESLSSGEEFKESIKLRTVAQLMGGLLPMGFHAMSFDKYTTTAHYSFTNNHLECCRFSGTVWPQQAHTGRPDEDTQIEHSLELNTKTMLLTASLQRKYYLPHWCSSTSWIPLERPGPDASTESHCNLLFPPRLWPHRDLRCALFYSTGRDPSGGSRKDTSRTQQPSARWSKGR